MIYGRERTDLLEEGLAIPYTTPTGTTEWIELDNWLLGSQPGEAGEFITALGVFNSIDLEWREA